MVSGGGVGVPVGWFVGRGGDEAKVSAEMPPMADDITGWRLWEWLARGEEWE